MTWRILTGDCREVMATLDANSVDAIVTDPPYELGFMGKGWDKSGIAFDVDTWLAAYRVLKPGGHLLAFGGSRTFHRMTVAIEDAGFEIRDCLSWLYGSGFPKSLDVGKAIDKAAGAEREVVGRRQYARSPYKADGTRSENMDPRWSSARAFANGMETAPATPEAEQWDGWGTALKPSHEPVVLARKPVQIRDYCGIMALNLRELLCQLRSHVSIADESSTSSQSGYVVAFDSAQWNAVERCSTPDALYDLTDTWQFASGTVSSLSIVWSWLSILAAISRRESTYITETASSLITDLKTSSSLLSTITADTITQALTQPNGGASSVWFVDAIFRSALVKSSITLTTSAGESATARVDAGTLRPDAEFICLARKPFKGTVAANVLTYGTGALNIDGTRIGTDETITNHSRSSVSAISKGIYGDSTAQETHQTPGQSFGRWPANVILDETSAAMLDAQSGERGAGGYPARTNSRPGANGTMNAGWHAADKGHRINTDTGGASRFFYTAKASRAERNAGLEGMPEQESGAYGDFAGDGRGRQTEHAPRANHHPTVKPISLMRWLVRLVTPPGGIVLDPFMGSGSTGIAVDREGFDFIGIELNPEYAEIARKRIRGDAPLFDMEVPA